VPDMDSRKSHKTADSVNGVEARIGQQSARSRHSTDSDGLRRSGHCLGPATAVTRADVGEPLGHGILVTLNAAY
jgi:hypothetical protein